MHCEAISSAGCKPNSKGVGQYWTGYKLHLDVADGQIRIDESASNGKVGPTKNKKNRFAPMSESLRKEMTAWLKSHPHPWIFPTKRGLLYHRSAQALEDVLHRGKAVVPDLTYRMCRTTFATLFQGDAADRTAILGHHSEEFTLEVYRRAVVNRQRGSVEDMEKRIKVVRIDRKKKGAA